VDNKIRMPAKGGKLVACTPNIAKRQAQSIARVPKSRPREHGIPLNRLGSIRDDHNSL
jgi:hypothetical protein